MLLKAVVNINGGQIIARPKRVEEERLVFDAGTTVRGESSWCRMFRYWPLVVSVGNTRVTNADVVIFSTWPFHGFHNKSSRCGHMTQKDVNEKSLLPFAFLHLFFQGSRTFRPL